MKIEIELPDEIVTALKKKALKDLKSEEETIGDILYDYLDEYGFMAVK